MSINNAYKFDRPEFRTTKILDTGVVRLWDRGNGEYDCHIQGVGEQWHKFTIPALGYNVICDGLRLAASVIEQIENRR